MTDEETRARALQAAVTYAFPGEPLSLTLERALTFEVYIRLGMEGLPDLVRTKAA